MISSDDATDESATADASAFRAALEVRAITSRLRRRIMGVGDGDGLTSGQASVLIRVARAEATTASALAAVERVRPQSMAVTLAALEQAGCIVRRPDPTDGRRQIVAPTDLGRARVEGALDAGRAWLETALAEQYTEAERQTIIAAMALLERILG